MGMKKLVVAVDFSLPSIQALQVAIDLNQQLNGMLHIVYVADMDEDKIPSEKIDGNDTVEMKVFKDFRHHLEDLVEKMSKGKTEANIDVEYGDPTEGIVRVATKNSADIVIMGTHGRTGLDHLLVGSVAESVLRKMTIPLICVRGKIETTA